MSSSSLADHPVTIMTDKSGPTFKIQSECLKEYIKDRDIVSYKACGAYGCTFQLCNKEGECKYIIKITEIGTTEEDEQIFWNEVEIGADMSMLKVAPKVLESWICSGEKIYKGRTIKTLLGFIIMEEMTMTLEKYIYLYGKYLWPRYHSFIRQAILRDIDIMHNRGHIVHSDLHMRNIMLNVDKKGIPSEIRIIDFGEAYYTDDTELMKMETDEVESDLDIMDGRFLNKML